jgi:hypothetical protein
MPANSTSADLLPDNPRHSNGPEDWENSFFRVLRALRHLYFKHEKREPLDPERCQGCREIQDFMFKPQFRGDTTDRVGAEIYRPLTEPDTRVYCEVCDQLRPVIREPGPDGDVLCGVCKFIFPTA